MDTTQVADGWQVLALPHRKSNRNDTDASS